MSFGADFMETWLSPVGYQNGFTRAHSFDGDRDAAVAKFAYVAPRLSLAGMSADEWFAAQPGTEGVLALAMAHVILSERLAPAPPDAARLRDGLATLAPEKVAPFIGIDAKEIRRLARELDRKSTRLNSSHGYISYAVFCLKKKKNNKAPIVITHRHYNLECAVMHRRCTHQRFTA